MGVVRGEGNSHDEIDVRAQYIFRKLSKEIDIRSAGMKEGQLLSFKRQGMNLGKDGQIILRRTRTKSEETSPPMKLSQT